MLYLTNNDIDNCKSQLNTFLQNKINESDDRTIMCKGLTKENRIRIYNKLYRGLMAKKHYEENNVNLELYKYEDRRAPPRFINNNSIREPIPSRFNMTVTMYNSLKTEIRQANILVFVCLVMNVLGWLSLYHFDPIKVTEEEIKNKCNLFEHIQSMPMPM
jgi:hypothetical protein